MRQYTIYECEVCKKTSTDSKEILTCEAAHMGLTYDEWQEYKRLKSAAALAGFHLGSTKNEQTEAAFDKAIDELVGFEKKHRLIEK